MSKTWIPLTAALAALLAVIPPARPAAVPAHTPSNASSAHFLFQDNRGQLPLGAEYAAVGDGYTVTLAGGAADLRFRAPEGVGGLRLSVEGAAPAPLAIPLDRRPGDLHLVRGRSPDSWATGIARYGRIAYQDVLPGVDVEYYGKGRSLEVDVVLEAGVPPDSVALHLEGADALEATDAGVRVALGETVATLLPPVVYQADDDGRRRELRARYQVEGDRIRFDVDAYDPDRALVIDPVLVYGSYLGGSDAPDPYPYQYDFEDDKVETVMRVAVDDAGSIFLAGITNAPDFPGSVCEASADCTGRYAFVTKLSDNGETLAWTTLFGNDDFGNLRLIDLAVTPAGEAVIVANTGSLSFDDLPDTGDLDAIDDDCRAGGRAYMMWFDFSGQPSLAGQLPMMSVTAVASSDDGIVVGGTGAGIPYYDYDGMPPGYTTCVPESEWGPSLGAADQGGGAAAGYDAGGTRTFLTAFRGSASAMAIDPSGSTVMMGGNRLVRLAPNGAEIGYSVELPFYANPGPYYAYAYNGVGLDVDQEGSAYVAATVRSQHGVLPTSEGAYQRIPLGQREVYVMKVDQAGVTQWATYLGGEDNDVVHGVAVDDGGSLHIVGNTASFRGHFNGEWVDQIPFPLEPDPSRVFSFAFGPSFSHGVWDGFYTRLTPTGNVLHSSYFGGSYEDVPFDIAMNKRNQPVFGGQTRSRDLPVTNTGVQTGLADFSFIGSVPSDGFVMVAGDGIAFPTLPTTADFEYSGAGGDPISTFTGELYFTTPPDLEAGGGPGALSLTRYYASGLKRTGALGKNWRHNFMWRLVRDDDLVSVTTWKGRELRFQLEEGVWTSVGSLGRGFTLVEDGSAWALADAQRQRVLRFDDSGDLTAVITPRRTVTVTPAANGPASVTDGAHTFVFNYDGNDKLTGVTHGGRSVTFSVVDDQLVSATDPLVRTTTYVYDDAHEIEGLLVEAIDPSGTSAFVQTYDEQGRVETQRDSADRTWTFLYDGPLTTVVDPDGFEVSHTHDPRGSLIGVVDELGRETVMTTTGAGERESVVSPGGRGADLDYDEHGSVVGVVFPDGAATETIMGTYALGGVTIPLVDALVYPDGTSEVFTRDAAGRVTSLTTRLGDVFTYTYDAQGRVATVTNPDLETNTYTYDAAGNILTSTDAHNVTTTMTYDAYGRLATRTVGSATETFTWDDAGQLITYQDARGGTLEATYHPNGQVQTVTNAHDDVSSFAYGPQGRLVSTTDELGGTISFTYNDRGDLLSVRDENDHGPDFTYDAAGQLVASTDGEGNTWTRAWDDDGRLTALTSPDDRTTTFTYDDAGRLTSLTTPEGRTWSTTFDAQGYPAAVTDPAGHSLRYHYDDDGRVAAIVGPGELTVQIARNANGFMTSRQLPGGGVFGASISLAGRLLALTDPLGASTTFGFDARGRVDTITSPETSASLTYDDNDNVTARAFNDGLNLTHAFDALDRRTTATGLSLGYDERGAITSSNGLVLTRDPAAQLLGVQVAPGKSITYTYDDRGLLTSLADWTGATVTFEHNASGWLTAVRRPNGVDTELAYDDDGLLLRVHDVSGAGTVGDQQLTRGARGFVTQASRTLPTAASATASAAWSATYDLACRDDSGTYDGDGRLTAHGGRTFGYDAASRLTAFDPGTGGRTYAYDALGGLVARTDGGVTEAYVWNYGIPRPTVQTVRVGGVDDTYVLTTPSGVIVGVIDATTDAHRWYHHDEGGSLRFTTDDAGAVAGTFAHSPYGERLTATGVPERFTWQGAQGVIDDGDGLFHMRERVYDAVTARFVTRDPERAQVHPQLANPYAYAAGNPVFLSDPGGASPASFSIAKMDKSLNGTSDTANMGMLSLPNSASGTLDAGARIGRRLTLYAAKRLPPETLAKYGGRFGNRRALLDASKRLKTFRKTNPLTSSGTKLFAAAAGWEVAKGVDRMNQALEESKSIDQSNLDTLTRQLAAVEELRRTKRITPDRAEELSQQIRENYDYLQANQSASASGLAGALGLQNRQVGILTEGVLSFKNALGGAVPVPLDWIGLGDPPRPTTVR